MASILCTKIQLPSLYRFLKFAKDGQNMTPRKQIFGGFFGKKGGKSQNFENSFDTPKDAYISTLCAKFQPCNP